MHACLVYILYLEVPSNEGYIIYIAINEPLTPLTYVSIVKRPSGI